MVLRPANQSQVDLENIPPTATTHPKALVTRLTNDTARRNRARATGAARTPRYLASQAQARRRKETKKRTPPTTVRFNVTNIPSPDVEMADGSSQPRTIPINFPKELPRPEYKEITREMVLAVEPTLVDPDLQYLRDSLLAISPELMRSLSSVQSNPLRNTLPAEMTVVVSDDTSILPSHMLAVFGPSSPAPSTLDRPPPPRKVVLHPIHSLILALHCAHISKPPPPLPAPAHQPGQQTIDLPVWHLYLPFPMTYPPLSTYLYTKRVDNLLRAFCPSPPPPRLMQDPAVPVSYASTLAATFTAQTIAKHALVVHGLWKNVYTLGIFDDTLWDAIDVLWKTLLTALAIATGDRTAMLPALPRSPDAPVASSSSTPAPGQA